MERQPYLMDRATVDLKRRHPLGDHDPRFDRVARGDDGRPAMCSSPRSFASCGEISQKNSGCSSAR